MTSSARRVLHVITGLEMGGAEHMLTKVALASQGAVEQQVISLRDDGVFGAPLREAGIAVHPLGMRGLGDAMQGVRATEHHLRAWRPHVVHAWMYHAHLVSGWAAARAGVRGTIWNIRANRITRDVERTRTVALARGAGLLARRWARAIVCNSDAALEAHAAWGYPRERMQRIDNGFDTAALAPSAALRAALRSDLGLQPETPLVGVLGRLSLIKGQAQFLAAAQLVAAQHPSAHFVLAGPGVDQPDAALDALAHHPALVGRVHRLGAVSPPERFLTSLDIAVIPSIDEAFPNVLGEAMACGVPCVATDVGDCRRVLADYGRIVPARATDQLARAMLEMLALPRAAREALGAGARDRIVREFSMPAVVQQYLTLYARVAG